MLNKFGKPAIYLPCAMILWGIISTATAGAQNFAGLVVTRFFLGFVEAAYFVRLSDNNGTMTVIPLLTVVVAWLPLLSECLVHS
jgi:hypothetical protein